MRQLFFVCMIIIGLGQSSKAQDFASLDKQLQKSIVAFEKGQIIKAERLVDKLIAKEGSYAPAYVWKGKCLQAFEEHSTAYEAYYTACQLQPKVASHWLAMGDFKSSLGSLSIRKPASCSDCGKRFLPLNGERPTAASYFRSALVDYQKALALDENLAEAQYQLGLTHGALGDQEAACIATAKAAQLGYTPAFAYQKEHCTKND